jgi:hypothetical protein
VIVVDTTNLDYEGTTGYVLTISGSDGALAGAAVVTIAINNVNDNVPTIDDATGSVDEDAVTGTLVATLS